MIPTLLLILLLEGFITISVEVLTIRQLVPFYGGSVLMTSLIIGVFLLFLAVGYWRGGQHQKDILKVLYRNFALSFFWIGVGLSYSFLSVFYYMSLVYLNQSFLVSLALFLFLVLAPIVYWLGQTVPLTTNLFNQEQGVSRISGKALFLSTIGSFLGALLTSLVLFHFLGVAWTIVINCFLLLVLLCVMSAFQAKYYLQTGMFFLGLIFIFILNVSYEKNGFSRTNNYANYQVVALPDFSKVLQVNNSMSSKVTQDKKGFPYIEFIKRLLFDDMKLSNKEILVIGAGGFSMTAAGTHENQFTYVDIDPEIQTIAEEHFLKEPIKGAFVGEDARLFLQKHDKKWDVILSDVYSNQTTIPPMLLTQEYFQAIKKRLKPAGFMIVNAIANPFFENNYAKAIHQTIESVFPYCVVYPLEFSQPNANIIYICPNDSGSNKPIYRDDKTTATLDYYDSHRKDIQLGIQ